MKTKILIFAAVALMLGIAIPSCLDKGENTIVLEGGVITKEDPTPEPDPNPDPNPDPQPEPGPDLDPDETVISGGYYFQIDNAKLHDEKIPSGSCGELTDVYMNSMVLAGGTNIATIMTAKRYDKFYIGIKGVDGYYEYSPDALDYDDWYVYKIPLAYSMDYQRDIEIQISASSGDCVTGLFTQPIKFVKSQEGALNIVLTFDNDKDVDLHVVTPSGTEIFYGNPGGTFEYPDGKLAYMGLDHDSNAGCNIDGLNNENVVISEDFIEPGEYQVYVDLYGNCNPSIATNWTCTVRYKGELVQNTIGKNPATGVFQIGMDPGFSHDELSNLVIKFVIIQSKSGYELGNVTFKPNQPSEATLQKIARKR